MEDILFEGGMIYEVEAFLEENYQFRRNVMSGKCEMRANGKEEGEWKDVTEIVVNTHICVFLSCYYFGYSLRWPRASRPRSQWHPHLTVGEVGVPFNRTGRIISS